MKYLPLPLHWPLPSRRQQILLSGVVMASAFNLSYDDPSGLPPGSPPTRTCIISVSLLVLFTFSSVKYEGPWLSTQIMISSSIGITSFLIFSYYRTRWPLLFAPRTKLKGTCRLLLLWHILFYNERPVGFSPHEAHAHNAFFGWILPTLKTSEYSVLQIVGLDAAVVCHVPVELHEIHLLISWLALELFQDVILSVLSMLRVCGDDSNAC